MTLEKKRELVLAEYLNLLRKTTHHKNLVSGFADAENVHQEYLANFFEDLSNKHAFMCGVFNYDRSLWTHEEQRISALQYMHSSLTKKFDFKSKFLNFDCNLPKSQHSYVEWLGKQSMEKNNPIDQFDKWGETFSIKFQFTTGQLLTRANSWRGCSDPTIWACWYNILRIGTNGNGEDFGNRVPAVFYSFDGYVNKVHVHHSVNQQKDYDVSFAIESHKTYELIIVQQPFWHSPQKLCFNIFLDRVPLETYLEVDNTQGSPYKNVWVWLSDNFWPSFNDFGDVSFLRISKAPLPRYVFVKGTEFYIDFGYRTNVEADAICEARQMRVYEPNHISDVTINDLMASSNDLSWFWLSYPERKTCHAAWHSYHISCENFYQVVCEHNK